MQCTRGSFAVDSDAAEPAKFIAGTRIESFPFAEVVHLSPIDFTKLEEQQLRRAAILISRYFKQRCRDQLGTTNEVFPLLLPRS